MLRLSCEPQWDWNNAWLSLNSNFPLGGNWNLNLSPSPCWKALNSRKTAKVTFISDFFLEMQIMNLPWEFPFLSLIGSLSRVGSRHSYIDWQLGHFELTSYKQNTNNDYPRLNMINYNSCTLSIMYFKKNFRSESWIKLVKDIDLVIFQINRSDIIEILWKLEHQLKGKFMTTCE